MSRAPDMRLLCLVVYGLILLNSAPAVSSGHTPAVHIAKTFEDGTLIEHVLEVANPPHTLALLLSQRRMPENPNVFLQAHLRFHYEAPAGAAPLTREVFEALFALLLDRLQTAFGPDLALESFNAGGFLNLPSIEQSSIQAFREYTPWATYLSNPGTFSQWQIHQIVLDRWKSAGVFQPVITALDRAGYDAELSGFEKLFVYKAEASGLYPELQAWGIPGNARFPHPGTISFHLKKRP